MVQILQGADESPATPENLAGSAGNIAAIPAPKMAKSPQALTLTPRLLTFGRVLARM
jgi:hypothetical protein